MFGINCNGIVFYLDEVSDFYLCCIMEIDDKYWCLCFNDLEKYLF